ncbi:hypothetical protein PV08_10698 [Exophiala spinifera]|uniref:Uncharacterized protein n=1 Tax=Exophiala spinifera TaxID=91928 RepID=A0A0D2AXG0_9EURO|nr:uncharacterized protein PV08_10698 [Exophiala spinifera]KIW11398.1 hypothetical protein PV08_10698 [Exophiala spinifera]
MGGRRTSARLAAKQPEKSSPEHEPVQTPSTKRRKDGGLAFPEAKRARKTSQGGQKTLEDTLSNDTKEENPATTKEDKNTSQPSSEEETKDGSEPQETKQEDESGKAEEDTNMTAASDEKKEDVPQKQDESQFAEEDGPGKEGESNNVQANGNAVESGERDHVPSSILEKGIIYFFFRPRVNVDDPQDVKDIARTYIVMRPIPVDAKLGEGPIGDDGNCRLVAVPKKVLPTSGKDRFLSFVEKAKTTFSDLKDSFMPGSDYETKTQGTSHVPPVTPLAEGVYAITSTGRESHLAYNITIPHELGQVQKDLGLREKGSFVTSVKNPAAPAPSNASLPQGPEYPQELLDEFRSLRWKPLEPKFLDYVNAQFLLIGESYDKATEGRPKDERENNRLPEEEIEKLEGEDEIRIKHLKGDDSVFVDLGVAAKDFPKVPTTW